MCSPLLTSLSSSGCPSGWATQHFSTAHAEGPLRVGVQVVLYLPRWYREVPYRLHSSNLRLNPKKYELIRDRVTFLGHVVSSNGIEPDPTKTPTTSQHLHQFGPGRIVILETDASALGVGAVLSQKQDNGTIHLTAYASRSLNQHERNYMYSVCRIMGQYIQLPIPLSQSTNMRETTESLNLRQSASVDSLVLLHLSARTSMHPVYWPHHLTCYLEYAQTIWNVSQMGRYYTGNGYHYQAQSRQEISMLMYSQ